jgi:hypothetical protein
MLSYAPGAGRRYDKDVERDDVQNIAEVLERDGERLVSPRAEMRRASPVEPVVSVRMVDGNTVLTLADRSRLVLVGASQFDQLSLFAKAGRQISRIV